MGCGRPTRGSKLRIEFETAILVLGEVIDGHLEADWAEIVLCTSIVFADRERQQSKISSREQLLLFSTQVHVTV